MLSEEILLEISEKMGEAVHNKRMEKRKKEKGWHNPEECSMKGKNNFTRNENGIVLYCMNCHPCMRLYKDLPESEKELDRQYPKLFFDILKEMSYEVISEDEILEMVDQKERMMDDLS